MAWSKGVNMLLRDAEYRDLPQIVEIVNALLSTTTIEWTDAPYTLENRERWLSYHRNGGEPVLVAELNGELAGFASYGDFRDSKKWPGYRFTVENTIHVRDKYWRRGIGHALIEALVERASNSGKHAMIAAIDADNTASIALHARCGFIEVARIPAVGWKLQRWLSLILMQRFVSGGRGAGHLAVL